MTLHASSIGKPSGESRIFSIDASEARIFIIDASEASIFIIDATIVYEQSPDDIDLSANFGIQ